MAVTGSVEGGLLSGEERREFIEWCIGKWQERLRVQDWDVRYLDEEPGENCQGDNHSWGLKRIAVIRIAQGVRQREALERLVVHEVLHLVFDPLRVLGLNAANGMAPVLRDDYGEAIDAEVDVAIEQITTALTGQRYIAAENSNEHYVRAFGEPRKSQWAVE